MTQTQPPKPPPHTPSLFLDRPATVIAVVTAVSIALAMSMIRAIFFDLPPLRLMLTLGLQAQTLKSLGMWLFVALLLGSYLSTLLVLGPPSPLDDLLPTTWMNKWPRTERVQRRLLRLTDALLVNPAAQMSPKIRRLLGKLQMVLAGLLLLTTLLPQMRLHVERLPSLMSWVMLLLAIGAWLNWGIFPSKHGESRTSSKVGFGLPTLVTGRALTLTGLSGAVGDFLWFLAGHAWHVFNWRLYSLWALVHIGIFLVCVGALCDAGGDSTRKRCGILGIFFAIFLGSFALPIHLGEPIVVQAPSSRAPMATSTDTCAGPAIHMDANSLNLYTTWFAAVLERLQAMPPGEPVILVAAAGGGVRASLYATLVMEALERTPPSGPLGEWMQKPQGASLADRVLFVSSVSGGSVAAAHFVLGQHPHLANLPVGATPVDVSTPINTLPQELMMQFEDELNELCARNQELCDEETTAGLTDGPQCTIKARLCESRDPRIPHSGEGFDRRHYKDNPELPGWPVGSTRFDDMATDFDAALLRGMVLPMVERGESITQFWRDTFHWTTTFQAQPLHPRPLLLLNITNAEDGTRLVAGFPRLPPKLLGAGEQRTYAMGVPGQVRMLPGEGRTLADLDPTMHVDVEQAVRMSANFPWGFDLPNLGLAGGRHIVAIDGGVLDNSGVDTFSMLLQRLEVLGDPRSDNCNPPAVREGARQVMDELTRRGVVLLEIDSGAKPEDPGALTRTLASLLLPLDSLNMCAFVRSSESTRTNASLMQLILGHWADNEFWRTTLAKLGPEQTPDTLTISGLRLAHVVYVLDTEDIMTAWALTPTQKGQLLARFLEEDSSQRITLRAAYEDLAGANQILRDAMDKPLDVAHLHFLNQLTVLGRELERRRGADMAQATETRRARYDNAKAQVKAEHTGVMATRPDTGWIYLGYFRQTAATLAKSALAAVGAPRGLSCKALDELQTESTEQEKTGWLTALFDTTRSKPPACLLDQTIELTEPAFLTADMPDSSGHIPPSDRVLRSRAQVHVEEIRPWLDTMFQFARVTVVRDAGL